MDWRKSSRSANNGACAEVAAWHKSSFCSNGTCVEVAVLDGLAVLVRDSTDPDGPVLALSAGTWQALVRRVKAGGDGS